MFYEDCKSRGCYNRSWESSESINLLAEKKDNEGGRESEGTFELSFLFSSCKLRALK